MADRPSHTVAVVQHPSVWLDRASTLERAVGLIHEAASNGARLISFPETFIPTYPAWVWLLKPSAMRTAEELYARLLDQAVDLSRDDLRPLRVAAREHGVTIVCGIDEIDRRFSGTTVYNTAVVIGPDGRLLNRHRKLVPTNAERMIWAHGDTAGLRVIDTPSGRVATLICWENYMPLARFALYAQGVEIYIAPTWAMGDQWVASMRHIAFEGRCWVIGNSSALTVEDVPIDTPGRDQICAGTDKWINKGFSVIVDPEGEIVAGPLVDETGILYAECDVRAVDRARYRLDVAGHYGRPDAFRLQVRREPGNPIEIPTSDTGSSDGTMLDRPGAVGALEVPPPTESPATKLT